MRFFRLEPLRDQLVGQGLTERDRFKYVMAWMLFMSWSMYEAGDTPEGWGPTYLIADVLVTFFGIMYAWRRNGRDAGTAFFDRYFSIGWVINFRTFVVIKLLFTVLI